MNEVTLTFSEQSTARIALLGMMHGLQNDLARADFFPASVDYTCDEYQEAYALYVKLLKEGLGCHPDDLRRTA